MASNLTLVGELWTSGGLLCVIPKSRVPNWTGVALGNETGHYDRLLYFFENTLTRPDYLHYFVDGEDRFLMCTSETKNFTLLRGENCFAIVELYSRNSNWWFDTPITPEIISKTDIQIEVDQPLCFFDATLDGAELNFDGEGIYGSTEHSTFLDIALLSFPVGLYEAYEIKYFVEGMVSLNGYFFCRV